MEKSSETKETSENSKSYVPLKRIPSLICDNLYLGGVFDSQRKETLKDLGVTHILIVGRNLFKSFPKDFKYTAIDISDEPYENITKYFESSYQFIKNGIDKGVCFVHCAFGQSRSASIVISYLMKENKWTYQEAYEYTKSKREVVCPNSGFENQLRLYQIDLGLKTKDEVREEIKEKSESKVAKDYKYFN